MTRKHATMTDGDGIRLAFQSEHGGFDCSEASIDRISVSYTHLRAHET